MNDGCGKIGLYLASHVIHMLALVRGTGAPMVLEKLQLKLHVGERQISNEACFHTRSGGFRKMSNPAIRHRPHIAANDEFNWISTKLYLPRLFRCIRKSHW